MPVVPAFRECPLLVVRWWYGSGTSEQDGVEWRPFSERDTAALETHFQATIVAASAPRQSRINRASLVSRASTLEAVAPERIHVTRPDFLAHDCVAVKKNRYVVHLSTMEMQLTMCGDMFSRLKVVRGTWFRTGSGANKPFHPILNESLCIELEHSFRHVKPWNKSIRAPWRQNATGQVVPLDPRIATTEASALLFHYDPSNPSKVLILNEHQWAVYAAEMAAGKEKPSTLAFNEQTCIVLQRGWELPHGMTLKEVTSRKNVIPLGTPNILIQSSTGTTTGTAQNVLHTVAIDGQRSMPVSNKPAPPPVSHVVFYIHGIGQKYLNYYTGIEVLRKTFQKQLERMSDPSKVKRLHRVEFVPIEWRKTLPEVVPVSLQDKDHMIGSMEHLRVDSIPLVRDALMGTFMDLLYYMSPFYCQAIHSIICTQMTDTYRMWRQWYPHFETEGGKVSVIGHSLGGLIALDLSIYGKFAQSPVNEIVPRGPTPAHQLLEEALILAEKLKNMPNMLTSHTMNALIHGNSDNECPLDPMRRIVFPELPFEIHHLILLGSPASIAVAARGDHLHPNKERTECQRVWPQCHGLFFNIFMENDPVAFRIEPLIADEWTLTKPVKVNRASKVVLNIQVPEQAPAEILVPQQSNSSSFWQWISCRASQDVLMPSQRQMTATSNNHPASQQDPSRVNENCTAADLIRQLNSRHQRVDFQLRPTPLVNEYLTALRAHFGYVSSKDLAALLVETFYTWSS